MGLMFFCIDSVLKIVVIYHVQMGFVIIFIPLGVWFTPQGY